MDDQEKQQTEKRWLNYWLDILRHPDIESLPVNPDMREAIHGPDARIELPWNWISNGQVTLDEKRRQWLSRLDRKDPLRKGWMGQHPFDAFIAIGYEPDEAVPTSGKDPVTLMISARVDPTTGKLAPPRVGFKSLVISGRHLRPKGKISRPMEVALREPVLGYFDDALRISGIHPGAASDQSEKFDCGKWPDYWGKVNKEFSQLDGNPHHFSLDIFSFDKPSRHLTCLGLVPLDETQPRMTEKIRKLIKQRLLNLNSENRLMNQIIAPDRDRTKIIPTPGSGVAFRHQSMPVLLGHLQSDFGLDPYQRCAVLGCLEVEKDHGGVVPVTGPPGTGKTSFLRSLVAHEVVRGAINGGPPPVIVATSATNQAVTNLIKAFLSVANELQPEDEVSFSHRFIDALPGYGWFAPSSTQASMEDNKEFQQLLLRGKDWRAGGIGGDFGAVTLPTPKQVEDLNKRYLERFKKAADHAGWKVSVSSSLDASTRISDYLRKHLIDKKGSLRSLKDALYRVARAKLNFDGTLEQADKSYQSALRSRDRDLFKKFDSRKKERRINEIKQTRAFAKRIESRIANLQRQSVVLSRLLAPARWALYVLLTLYAWQHGCLRSRQLIPTLDHRISRIHGATLWHYWEKAQPEIDKALLYCREHDKNAHELKKELESAFSKPVGTKEALDTLDNKCQCFLDLTWRLHGFHLAMRYWEARWLNTPDPSDARKCLEKSAMLAPVVVSTVNTLPALFTTSGGTFAWGAADWLIMDEASQAPPSTAMPMFLLSKRALVLGDPDQLAPVVTLSEQDNIQFQIYRDCYERGVYREQLDEICGSAMEAALYSASVGISKEQPGVVLRRHYRCPPSIIEISNSLVYREKGYKLIPHRKDREKSDHDQGHPHITTVKVDGKAAQGEGSQSAINEQEVNAIIDWLRKNRDLIKTRYERSLQESVAVLTPYRSQADLLKRRLREAGLTGSGKNSMKIGTVHVMQGAERHVVLFSCVAHTKTPFLDNNANLINVAVSRAKDRLIVFMHENLYETRAQTPIGRMAEHLRKANGSPD